MFNAVLLAKFVVNCWNLIVYFGQIWILISRQFWHVVFICEILLLRNICFQPKSALLMLLYHSLCAFYTIFISIFKRSKMFFELRFEIICWISGFQWGLWRCIIFWKPLLKRLLNHNSFQMLPTFWQILENTFLLRHQTRRSCSHRLWLLKSLEANILFRKHLSSHESLLRLLWLSIDHQRWHRRILRRRIE